VHDLAAHRLVLHGHAVVAVAQHFDDAAKAALHVEGQRLLACRCEKQIVRQLHDRRPLHYITIALQSRDVVNP
jgi:hypothetical protein